MTGETKAAMPTREQIRRSTADRREGGDLPQGARDETAAPEGEAAAPKFDISTSRQFSSWLHEQNVSLVFTTYQAGKIFLLGLQANGRLSVFERTLSRCMGMCVTENSLYVSTLFQLWRFENVLQPGQQSDDYDRVYVPQVGYVTGDLDIHDVAVDGDGRIVFVNTLFGCVATVSETASFVPLWQPPFLSKLAAEDRCHLNGLALREGRPAFATATSESDVVDGWREHRADGGCVIDMALNEVVARGLSMPHSPRWHGDRLWLHNSGTGEFGCVDFDAGRFEPVCFCPGYLRGLAFIGDYAVVGLSQARENKTFNGLALDEALERRKASAQCGLYVIDLRSGDAVHWVRFEGIVRELYDVAVLPGVRRPMAIGFQTDEIRRVINIGTGD